MVTYHDPQIKYSRNIIREREKPVADFMSSVFQLIKEITNKMLIK
jgi:hypothetical protein